MDAPTLAILIAFAFFTMCGVKSIWRGFPVELALIGAQPQSKVLVQDRDATYYKGKGSPRERMSAELRAEIWQRDGGCCRHCGAECYLGERTPQDVAQGRRKAFYGHWVSNAIGGPEVSGNLHISCGDCNLEMGSDIILQPALDFIQSRGETINPAGLVIAEGCQTILEYKQMKVAA